MIDEAYMGLGVNEAAAGLMQTLKTRCEDVGGKFSLLRHKSPRLKNTYQNAVSDSFQKRIVPPVSKDFNQ